VTLRLLSTALSLRRENNSGGRFFSIERRSQRNSSPSFKHAAGAPRAASASESLNVKCPPANWLPPVHSLTLVNKVSQANATRSAQS